MLRTPLRRMKCWRLRWGNPAAMTDGAALPIPAPGDVSGPDRDLGLLGTEMSAFITPRALVTVRKSAFDIDRIIARWDAPGAPVSCGVGFLVHGWLDAIVDGQYQAAQALDDVADD